MDYIKYVDEVAKEKSQYTFPDTLTGIEQLANDDYTIMHTLDVMLRGTYLENPFAFPDIKLFGKTRSVLLLCHIWFVTFQRYISMTQLLLHTFPHLTGPSFRVKAKLLLNKFFFGLV